MANGARQQNGSPHRSGVQSIDRAATILRCFDARHPELGTSEIARMTGLSTSTTHRLLVAMQQNHLIRQTAGRRFGLGPMLMRLARSGALPTGLRDAALPFMTELRDEVDETVGLHELLDSHQRVVIDQVESRQELRRTYTDIGIPIALPHGAPGKAILAFLPVSAQDRCLEEPISAITDRTVTDPDDLRAELAVARDRGWAGSDSERTPGIRAVAAPIFDHTGNVVGALGVSVPVVRMGDDRADELGRRASEVAWDVSVALGATRAGVDAAIR
ncbi:MAG: IclR family transcriptional regulator [Nocardioidaceae bacterium]